MPSSLQVKSLSAIPAGTRAWRSLRRGVAHTVVCKATYVIEAGECSLAPDQEPLAPADAYWNDDPRKSLRLATDWAPFKRRADVVLVGSAFAPGNTQVRRLVVCLAVGAMEKALEIHCDRWVGMDEQLQEGPAFARMALVWERAGGGADTNNPAGRAVTRDPFGKIQLPNLQPLAFDPRGPAWEVEPVGFGPIAPSWPTRAHSMGAYAQHGIDALLESGLPDDFDYSYFQVAPRDQQLDRFHTDTQLLLENLLPSVSRLVTRLPGHRARAIVEPGGREVDLTPDTIWIDTDHQLLTITWRGNVWASEHPGASRVIIAIEPKDAQFTPEQIRELGGSGEETMSLKIQDEPSTGGLPFGTARAPEPRPSVDSYAGTPFGRQAASAAKPSFSKPLPSFETAELPAVVDGLSTSEIIERHLANTSASVAQAPAPPAPVPPAPAMAPPPPPPVAQPAMAPPAMAPPPPIAPPAMAPPAMAPPAMAPPAMAPPPPPPVAQPIPAAKPAPAPPISSPGMRAATPGPMAPAFNTAALAASATPPSFMKDAKDVATPPATVGHAATAALAGVAGASDAAAAQKAPQKQRTADAAPREPAKRPSSFVDLLWFHSALPERLRADATWAKLLRAAPKGSEWLTDKESAEARAKEDRARDVARALARSVALDANGVANAVLEAVDEDGFLVRPMVVVEGDVAIAFDPLHALETMLSLSEPLALGDKRFKESHDAASELAKSTRKVTQPMLDGARERLRQAFIAAGSKAYPNGYLESTTERILIDERKFQKRMVLGDQRLVAHVTPAGSGTALPTYLPADLENVIPGLVRFKARMLCEPHAKQDANDGETTVLLVLAFARVLGR